MKRDVSSLYKGSGVRVNRGNKKEQWSESSPWNGTVTVFGGCKVEYEQ